MLFFVKYILTLTNYFNKILYIMNWYSNFKEEIIMNKTQKRSSLKKELILNEAIKLFANQGFFATTMSKIAESADVSFGSVAYYYGNKEKLFEAAVLAPFEDLRKLFLLVQEISGSPLEKIHKMVYEQMNFLIHQSSSIRLVQYVVVHREQFPQLMRKILIFWNDSLEIVSPVIIEGQKVGELIPIRPNVVFSSYFSYLIGTILTIIDHPSHPIWEDFIQQGLRLFGFKEEMMNKDLLT